MEPKIKIIEEKKLVGKHLEMSLFNNRMPELWGSFMSVRREVKNVLSKDLISMVIYSEDHFKRFNVVNKFERWATVEVEDFDSQPEMFEFYVLKGGLYAVFEYQGLNTDHTIFQYIFNEWIPNSKYELDNRPHFEVLGEKYKNNDPTSEEEIWIPIRLK